MAFFEWRKHLFDWNNFQKAVEGINYLPPTTLALSLRRLFNPHSHHSTHGPNNLHKTEFRRLRLKSKCIIPRGPCFNIWYGTVCSGHKVRGFNFRTFFSTWSLDSCLHEAIFKNSIFLSESINIRLTGYSNLPTGMSVWLNYVCESYRKWLAFALRCLQNQVKKSLLFKKIIFLGFLSFEYHVRTSEWFNPLNALKCSQEFHLPTN